MKHLLCVWGALFLGALTGCYGSIDQDYFVQTVDSHQKPVNFFRVEVLGNSIAAQTRFVAGYYDVTAVDTYFGQFSQPENGSFPTAVSSSKKPTQPADPKPPTTGESAKPVPAETPPGPAVSAQPIVNGSPAPGKTLVLMLSSNSDAVVEAIQSIAESEAIAKTVSRLAQVEKFRAAAKMSEDAAHAAGTGKVAATTGDATIGTLTDTSTDVEARNKVLRLANDLASVLGHDRVFTSAADAKAFVEMIDKQGGVK